MRPPVAIAQAASALAGKVFEPKTFIKHESLQAQLDPVFRHIPTPNPDQFRVEQTRDGPVWNLRTAPLPLQPVSAGGNLYTFSPGTINGLFPTLGGTAINASPAPTLDVGTGPLEVWVMLTWALAFNHDWLATATLTSAAIQSGSAVPSNDTAGGIFYEPLATFDGGRVVGAYFTRSGSFQLGANGANNATLITLQK